MYTQSSRFVIVGSGQSGGWAAKTLRDAGFTGSISLIGNEPHLPYERPPLSKGVLSGQADPDSSRLWAAEKLKDLSIDTICGTTVTSINREEKIVLADGYREFPYDRLLLATGARVRKLACPGSDLPGVFYLRTIEDSLRLRTAIREGMRVVVIGGGWIGLEVAATLNQRGARVSVVEASDRLCGRSLPRTLGSWLQRQHEQHGVQVYLNAPVQRITGADYAQSVCLQDGAELPASVIVVGIGVEPNVELALACGLDVSNGIVVDADCRTSDPDIFASGDVASQPVGYGRVRFESWKNAQDQGIAAAKGMLDLVPDRADVPWFWSDQYDFNLQLLGQIPLNVRQYRKGDDSEREFTDYFVQDDRLVAVAAVNRPRDIREAKKLLKESRSIDFSGLVEVADHNIEFGV